MLTQTADKLRSRDKFTADQGATWHIVEWVSVVKVTSDATAVLITTDDYQKIWLWAEEEVTVRI